MSLLGRIVERNQAEDQRRLAERLAYFAGKVPARGPRPLDSEHNQPKWPKNCEIPEVSAQELNDNALRSAMASRGCLIVRGYLDPTTISEYRAIIDIAMEAGAETLSSQSNRDVVENVFQNPPLNLSDLLPEPKLKRSRSFHREGGSTMCVESASVSEQLLEFFEVVGIKELVTRYLGEPPCLSALKWVLRRPKVPTRADGWHQDGAFMGSGINSLNMWIPVSPCGGHSGAPSMDIVPKRLTHIVGASDNDAVFDWSVGKQSLDQLLLDTEIVTPAFEPGDAFFFDHFLLHRTQYAEQFSTLRYAIETWFFGERNFPANQLPLRW